SRPARDSRCRFVGALVRRLEARPDLSRRPASAVRSERGRVAAHLARTHRLASPRVDRPRRTAVTHRVADGGARSRGERWFCGDCGSHLYVLDDRRPEGGWPNAAALDTELPVPPERVHIMLRFKPDWVPVEPGGERFPVYPKLSIAEWHA